MTLSPCASRAATREEALAAVVDACLLGDATLRAHIDHLRSAMPDPERMRSLQSRLRREVDAARALLEAAAEPEWWCDVTAERLGAACQAARIWSEGDPVVADLERRLASQLRRVFGIDLAGVPRR
ncbi:hypothetical protein Q0F99_11380 [Rathayibacter oskolensis]|uniref:hypothetical protein n=1 Tax=Rathayibacter oskolensis TaxID=1891671 RepID=UPI00265F10BB|nr:hypothetical protein [Rathayibacter oskolensis]WKK70470.1 hypothetical protein Q0F99_11380 [Rathayibacter oskolensis]